MKVWIHLNGIQQGPYELEQLRHLPVEPSTPVWYEGLPQWMQASDAPATASLFTPPEIPSVTVEQLAPQRQDNAAGENVGATEESANEEGVSGNTPEIPNGENQQAGYQQSEPVRQPQYQQPQQQQYQPQQQYYVQPGQQQYNPYVQPQNDSQVPPPQPSSYLVWSLVLTILCCSPFAVAAVITGIMSSTRYSSGNYAGAKRLSDVTEWLIILAIVFSIVTLPISAVIF